MVCATYEESIPSDVPLTELSDVEISQKISVVYRDEGWTSTLNKDITLFILLGVWETEGDNDKLLYWPITSSLDHSMMEFVKNVLFHEQVGQLRSPYPLFSSDILKALFEVKGVHMSVFIKICSRSI